MMMRRKENIKQEKIEFFFFFLENILEIFFFCNCRWARNQLFVERNWRDCF
jgi:hypothetical protein